MIARRRRAPLVSGEAARHNFTNGGGVFGTIRLLKNVTGPWVFESCHAGWAARGAGVGYDELLREVERIEGRPGFIFPDDPRLFNPTSMLGAVAARLEETGQNVSVEDPARLTKVILDSLAFRYASVLRAGESLTGERVEGVQIVGGGSPNDYLNQARTDAAALSVLAEARRHVASNVKPKTFAPRGASEEAAREYARVESRYVTRRGETR